MRYFLRPTFVLIPNALAVILGSGNAFGATASMPSGANQLSATKQLIRQGQPETALKILEQIGDSEKNSTEYHFLRGRALQELKLNIDALGSYSIAIYIDRRNVSARINKALIRGALGDINGALQELNEASGIEPDNKLIYMNRGVTYAGLNQPQKALQDFNQAIRLDRKYADAYRNRGITRHYTGDLTGACRDWRQAAFYGDEDTGSWVTHYCNKNKSDDPGRRASDAKNKR